MRRPVFSFCRQGKREAAFVVKTHPLSVECNQIESRRITTHGHPGGCLSGHSPAFPEKTRLATGRLRRAVRICSPEAVGSFSGGSMRPARTYGLASRTTPAMMSHGFCPRIRFGARRHKRLRVRLYTNRVCMCMVLESSPFYKKKPHQKQ